MPLHPGLRNLFQVWSRIGAAGPRFRSLRDAIRYVRTLHKPGEHRILRPDGHWVEVPAPVPTPPPIQLPTQLPDVQRASSSRNVIEALPLRAHEDTSPAVRAVPDADQDFEVETLTVDMSIDEKVEEDHNDRRRSRRIATLQPAVLELNPGRVNVSMRPVIPSTILDACETGLRISLLEEDDYTPLPHELLWVRIVGDEEGLDVPARVVWYRGSMMGVRCQLIDPALQDEFYAWLARAPANLTR